MGPSADPRHPGRAATPIGDFAEGMVTGDFHPWRRLLFFMSLKTKELGEVSAPSRVVARRKVWFLRDIRIFHAISDFI